MADYAEAISSRPQPRKKSGPKEIRSIEIEKAENGGHTVTHRFKHDDGGPYHESEAHVFGASEGKKMLAHLKEHLDIKSSSSAEED